MRKTFAILLLFVHAFNLAGYHFIYNYYKQQATVQIDGKIDRGQYQYSDLVEVNIPYSVPYASSRLIADRFNGEIEVAGVTYNYVSLQLINDTLHLRCLPNAEKTKLAATSYEFAKQWSQGANTNKKSENNGFGQKNIFAEYNDSHAEWQVNVTVLQVSDYLSSTNARTTAGYLFSVLQPPRTTQLLTGVS